MEATRSPQTSVYFSGLHTAKCQKLGGGGSVSTTDGNGSSSHTATVTWPQNGPDGVVRQTERASRTQLLHSSAYVVPRGNLTSRLWRTDGHRHTQTSLAAQPDALHSYRAECFRFPQRSSGNIVMQCFESIPTFRRNVPPPSSG
jgi:hypothetical protein